MWCLESEATGQKTHQGVAHDNHGGQLGLVVHERPHRADVPAEMAHPPVHDRPFAVVLPALRVRQARLVLLGVAERVKVEAVREGLEVRVGHEDHGGGRLVIVGCVR